MVGGDLKTTLAGVEDPEMRDQAIIQFDHDLMPQTLRSDPHRQPRA
jgi:hypothetical protein